MATFAKVVKPENLLIVDALNVGFRFKHKKATKFVDEYIATVLSLATSYECGTIIVAADQGGSEYRKSIYPEYKANRKDLYNNQTPEEKKQSEQFFAEYERTLEAIDNHPKMKLFRFQGVEADDIAAYLTSRMYDYGFDKVWLISSDRDWDLLITKDVSRFSTVTRQEITLETWPHPVPPDQYISLKVLEGDKGDNVHGFDGVGPKRAADLITQYGSAYDIYDAIPLAGKQKFVQAINDNKDRIILNYELMDLPSFCQDALGHDNILEIGRRLMKEF